MYDDSAVGKLLPNLKVTFKEDNAISDGEDGEIYDDTESQMPSAVLTKEEFAFKWASTLETAKVHPNKYGGFETGLDLSSEHLKKKLETRAARFGLKKEEQCQITSEEIKALYKSLGMDPENLESSCKNIRLGVIHIRGVKEMSSKDVLDYFKDYGPSAIEWINDVSCNVCWFDNVSAARALLGVSQPIVIKRKSKNISEAKGSSEISESNETNKSAAISEENETTSQDDILMGLDEESVDSSSEDDLKNLECDISIPPGNWRLGIPHPKANTLLLRFATKDDKKVRGAEKRSEYYQKYGNPNYGGMRGLISKSRKRKYQAMHTRQVVESLSSNKEDFSAAPGVKKNRQRLNIPIDSRRMYADIEEDRVAERSSQFQGSSKSRQSIKSRLGKRYSKDDLYKIGSRFSSEEDAPVEELSVECKIPSRFSIWNEQAKAMAEEEKALMSEEEELDDEEEGLDDEEEGLDDDEEEYSVRRDKRYCAYGSERASYDSHKQSGYSGNSKDLRETLNSSRRRNKSPRKDLRSRIGNLKSYNSQKHRSPLCRDDL